MFTYPVSVTQFVAEAYGIRLTRGQEDILDSLTSCRVTIVPESPRCSGRTLALMGYLLWKEVYSERPMSVLFHDRNAYMSKDIIKHIADRTNGKPRLNITSETRLNARRGMEPDDLVITTLDASGQQMDEFRELLAKDRSYEGRRVMYYKPMAYTYDAYTSEMVETVTTYHHEGSRYLITTHDTEDMAYSISRMGVDPDDISIIDSLTPLPKNYKMRGYPNDHFI